MSTNLTEIPFIALTLIVSANDKEYMRSAIIKPSPNNKNRFYVFINSPDHDRMRFDFVFGSSMGLVKTSTNWVDYFDNHDPLFDLFALKAQIVIERSVTALDLIKLLDWQENSINSKDMKKIHMQQLNDLKAKRNSMEFDLLSLNNRIEDLEKDPILTSELLSI